MNPRTFCEERGYPWALFLTYSFDPVFFERLVLRDLQRGDSHGILVVADRGEVERALSAPSPLIHQLGRSYFLASATAGGAFHPKIFLRLGRTGGLAWIGTGNLTHGGWGANQELATAWRVGPEADDPGGWVAPLLRRVAEWTPSSLATEVISPMLTLDWVRESDGLSDAPFLLSDREPIGDQIEARWQGRRFDTLDVLTGSTDRSGEMLRWAHRVFGVQRVRIALDPRRTLFDLEEVSNLPLDIEIVPTLSPPLHAKLYWFDGPKGPAAIVGSPNCSAAAWLLPRSTRGNLEAAMVFDHPVPEDFSDALRPLRSDSKPASEVLLARDDRDSTNEVIVRFRIASLIWDQELARIEVSFAGETPPLDAVAMLVLQSETIPLTARDGSWTGAQPESMTGGRTVIGRVRIQLPDGTEHETPAHWLDAPHLLRQALIGRRHATPLLDLNRTLTAREDDALVQELTQLAQNLLTDAAAFSDPLRMLSRQKRERPPEEGRLVEAERIIRSLYDTAVPLAHPMEGVHGSTLGINGIYRALFIDGLEGDESDSSPDVEPEEFEDEDNDVDDEGVPNLSTQEDTPEPVSEKHRRRFEQHLGKYMEGLHTTDFARRCTATQLRQAIGYPIAACVLGRKRRWTDDEQALEWIKGAADLLLYGHAGELSLLEEVESRYTGERREAFESIVGDGVLWVALASALVNVPWRGPEAALHRIVLLADLWNADVLRAAAPPERISELARRYKAEDAVRAIREFAAPAAACVGALEDRLLHIAEEMRTDPGHQRDPILSGEILWGGARSRWAVAVGQEQAGKVSMYWVKRGAPSKFIVDPIWISVRQVSARDPIVDNAYRGLVALVERIMGAGESVETMIPERVCS